MNSRYERIQFALFHSHFSRNRVLYISIVWRFVSCCNRHSSASPAGYTLIVRRRPFTNESLTLRHTKNTKKKPTTELNRWWALMPRSDTAMLPFLTTSFVLINYGSVTESCQEKFLKSLGFINEAYYSICLAP